MYLAIGIVCLLAIVATVGMWVYQTATKKNKSVISSENVLYLVPSFLIIYALYLTASFYNKETVDFNYCFTLISKVLSVFGYEFELDLISTISATEWIYAIDFMLAGLLASAATVLTVLSFFKKTLGNWYRKNKIFCNSGDIVLGDSETARLYLEKNPNTLLWDADISAEEYSSLLKRGYTVCKEPFDSEKVLNKLGKREHHLIVFKDSQKSYFDMVGLFTKIKSKEENLLFLHLESTVEEMKIITDKLIDKADKSTNTFISCFSNHELLARQFILEHPITRYIPKSFYNDNFTLKEEKEINVVFMGFGRVNYELFKLMSMQFQFATEDKETGGLKGKPVHYYVFDEDENRLHSEYVSKLLYEVDENFADSDFEKPEAVCDLKKPQRLNIRSIEARKLFKSLVNENNYTYFIISLNDDFSDASYAHTLKRLFPAEGNYKIFVRLKQNDVAKMNETEENVVYFGGKNGMLCHNCIVNDELLTLSQKIHAFYNKVASDRLSLLREWESLPLVEQYSNLYSALNIRFKLNMMGIDMRKSVQNNEMQIDKNSYLAIYNNRFANKKIDEFSFFFETNACNVIAHIEHSRWNAAYIQLDYRPMKIQDFYWLEKKDKKTGAVQRRLEHKNTAKKLHACLTTYRGLEKLMEEKYKVIYPGKIIDKTSGEFMELDLYGYDYMVMDAVYDAVSAIGYSLVKWRN